MSRSFADPRQRPQHVGMGLAGAFAAVGVMAIVGLRAAEASRPAPKPLAAVALVSPQDTPGLAEPAPLGEPPPLTFTPVTTTEAEATNAATPFADAPLVVATPTKIKFTNDVDKDRAVQCLTQAVYYEAAFEPLQGRRAVAQVVLNRMHNTLFPKTVCGVVFQGAYLPTGCQFSFTCDGALSRPVDHKAWAEAKDVAVAALNGVVEPSVGLSTHYHTKFVVPYWKPTLVKLAQLGAHIFYRWPGGLGEARAFAAVYLGGEPLTSAPPKPALVIAPPILVAASAERPQEMVPLIAARTPIQVELAPVKPAKVIDIAPVAAAPVIAQVRPTFTPQKQVDWFGNQPAMQGASHVN